MGFFPQITINQIPLRAFMQNYISNVFIIYQLHGSFPNSNVMNKKHDKIY